jgi:hypothetical protein
LRSLPNEQLGKLGKSYKSSRSDATPNFELLTRLLVLMAFAPLRKLLGVFWEQLHQEDELLEFF